MLGFIIKLNHLGLFRDSRYFNPSYFDFIAVRLINSNLAIIQLSSYLAKALTNSISSSVPRYPTLANSTETIVRQSGANYSSFAKSAPPVSASASRSALSG